MELVLLVIQVIIALFLIVSVLMQRSDSDGMGLGAGGGGGLLSSRGQANLMTRTTAILAFLFMSNSLLLGVITARSTSMSLVDEVVAEQPIQAPKDGLDQQKGQAPKDGLDKAVTDSAEKAKIDALDKATTDAETLKTKETPVKTDSKSAPAAEAPKAE